MICAEDEIGVGTGHDGIMVLPVDTPVGTPAATYFGLESDFLIEVDITPNRADACSHWGVARDLYAYLVRNGQPTALHRPDDAQFAVDHNELPIAVEVERPEACLRYCAVTLKGCEIKESPKWLQDKLNTIGLRPINNIVDITNYVMMAYGQPLHCFDADMIKGGKIVVKTLPEGTPFVTLDGEERKLSERDLAICNAEEPMCIAGVLGGKGSGTYDTTRDILFESAYFHPTWVRKSARRHGLNTDASFRFERGINPDGQLYALKQAALLAKELAGGEIAMEIVDVQSPELKKHFEVELEYKYVHELIGKEIPHDLIRTILTALDMEIVAENDAQLTLRVPAYRVDVQRPCDVVEDILRIYGYNNVEIPTSLKSSLTTKNACDVSQRLQNLVSEQLIGEGFNEILNNSLTREAYYSALKTHAPEHLVHLLNPLSSDLNVMRQTLLFGGLESIAHNVNRKEGNLRNWWTPQDKANFKARTERMVRFFDAIEVLPGLHCNGALTCGENIADHGGLKVAYQAFRNATARNPLPKFEGFTPDQRFFISYAQVWANNIRPEALRNQVKTDPHAPGRWRVNGALPQIDAWYNAFGIKKGDKLFVPKNKRVDVW